ncbi:MAG TPA: DUF1559 domain-containing protein [Isosphaeraceae bacterium]|nr:DUF1559 domain-containing protein [Isosphaeraceae bacterium]
MPEPKRRRAGFTLIELLIVIAIIGVLLGLLLPAIQSAREAARRAQCANNLMQIGLALKNYDSAHDVLPAGVFNPTGPIKNQPKGYHMSWLVQILPFIEETNAFNHTNFTNTVYDSSNRSVCSISISMFLCPSDPFGGGSAAPNNYAGCHHDVEAPIDADNHGILFLNSQIRYDDIPDGNATTLFVGEKRRSGGELGWMSGTRSTLRNTGTLLNLAIVPTAKNTDPVGGFSSAHSGGANHAFGDGSVRFIKLGINPTVYQLLGNRADGEIVGDDQF